MTYELATPLTQSVLALRRFKGELGPQAISDQNHILYHIPFAYRRVFVADVEEGTDQAMLTVVPR